MNRMPDSAQRGFTLIELMVALSILAILTMLAAPSFVGFVRNAELTSLTNRLVAALNAGRSEAMKTGRNAYLIPASQGTSWNAGWSVYVDIDGSGSYDPAVDMTVLAEHAPASYIDVSGTNNAANRSPYIGFGNAGYARSISGKGPANATLTIKRTDTTATSADAETRRIIVARTGRIRSCRPSTDTGCTADATD